jgi:hypothetical protein
VKPTSRLRNRRACIRYVTAGKLVRRRVKAGRRAVAFSGRLHGKALRPGRYRATIVAVRGHRRSRPKRARFTVVAGRSQGAPPPAVSTPPPSASPSSGGFPNPSTTGVPAGWTPRQTLGSLTVSTAGAVVSDTQVNGDVNINAPNVTLRRVLIRGILNNANNAGCAGNGLVVEDSTFEPPGGGAQWNQDHWQIGQGGYTLRRVKALRESDGPRLGGNSLGCGPVTVADSFINIAAPTPCGDWHGDGMQGFDSGGVTIRNVTIDFNAGRCGGNAGFFYPGGPDGTPKARADINGLLIRGGNFSFRMGTPGSVLGLKIVDGAWQYGPLVITDTGCSVIKPWDASVVTITPDFQVARTVRAVRCA